jgi:hypothetical protein
MAAFALPSSGAARTETRNATDPSASARKPSTASRRASGRAWTRMPSPSAAATKGPLEGVEEVDNLFADEPEQQDQD